MDLFEKHDLQNQTGLQLQDTASFLIANNEIKKDNFFNFVDLFIYIEDGIFRIQEASVDSPTLMIYQDILLVSYDITIYTAFNNISSSSYYIAIQLYTPTCILRSITILHSIYLPTIHKIAPFVYIYISLKDI